MDRLRLDSALNGLFYLFGFTENPAKKKVTEIMSKSVSEKIKADLKRVNSDYRKEFDKRYKLR
jgi:hypothetical protein